MTFHNQDQILIAESLSVVFLNCERQCIEIDSEFRNFKLFNLKLMKSDEIF